MEDPNKIVKRVWRIIIKFYSIKTIIQPELLVLENDLYGTRDKSKCHNKIILTYCPKKLKEELKSINYTRGEFVKFMTYAFAESLSMGAQKILMSKNCNNICKNCRAFNKSSKFKLLNYITTYYVADYVVFKMFKEEKFGISRILKKMDNKTSKLIMNAIVDVYSKRDGEEFIKDVSKHGNKTFLTYLANLNRLDNYMIRC